MTFTDALSTIEAATSATDTSTKNAAKRSSMFGYAWKFTLSKNGLTALTTSGDYYLALVQRDGDQYIYQYTKASDSFEYKGMVANSSGELDNTTAPTAGTTLALAAELLGHLGVGTDWSTNTQTVLDSLRTAGPGEW